MRALRLEMGELFNIIDGVELPVSASMNGDSNIPSPTTAVDTPGCFAEDQDGFDPKGLSGRGLTQQHGGSEKTGSRDSCARLGQRNRDRLDIWKCSMDAAWSVGKVIL